ncbi:nucleotidyltransferase domain-containing protein [Candidatus Nomurabacteria bacterium]|nr:nucleotidyltransferase domain-containing protein [Candidatus Nomurabacteria bacterium]
MSTNKLKPIGDVLHTDNAGFLIKNVSQETFYLPLKPLIDGLIKIAQSVFKSRLHSVYIRGSVAKGTFVPNISDLDSVFVVETEPSDDEFEEFKKEIKDINKKYPYVIGIEKNIQTVDQLVNSKSPIYKYQTVCVYGKDLTKDLPKIKPGKESVVHLEKIINSIDESLPKISKESEPHWIKHWSIWMCKQLIRSCHELIAEDLQQFARDIYPCYFATSKKWPENELLLRRVAEIAVFGTENKTELLDITRKMRGFLKPKIAEFYRQ